MHSPRTDGAGGPRASSTGVFHRLNVRLALALASVAIIALLTSGIALSQVLPGYFLDQAERGAEAAAVATGVLVHERVQIEIDQRPTWLTDPALRNARILGPIAAVAANELALGTVEITYPDGSFAARARPDAATSEALRAQGLLPDSQVAPRSAVYTMPVPLQAPVQLTITVRDPYTNRVATLEQVTRTLVGAGLAALAVSVFVGVLAARRLTGPLARLRRASSRFAQGDLEERAPPFGIIEVDELGEQFNVMADQVSESVRLLQADRDRLREFVADVSHELRTPIAALRTFTELQRDGEMDEETRREFLTRTSEQINRLEWLSTNLLDLSRIDAGIFPLDVRWGDLRDPVRSVVEAHAEIAEGRGVSLVSEVPTSPVMLRFDRERILQLLANLVGNALKFTPRGGQVFVILTDHEEGAMLEVRDTGPGIPAAELPLVFDRFFRGTNVGDARASGSGLGLAIARSIVEMHGGTIRVASQPGEGAAFTVQLPRPAPEDQ